MLLTVLDSPQRNPTVQTKCYIVKQVTCITHKTLLYSYINTNLIYNLLTIFLFIYYIYRINLWYPL